MFISTDDKDIICPRLGTAEEIASLVTYLASDEV